jgi:hypothetical protein
MSSEWIQISFQICKALLKHPVFKNINYITDSLCSEGFHGVFADLDTAELDTSIRRGKSPPSSRLKNEEV